MKQEILTPTSIRRFRKERGLSQQELATILNVGMITVSRWERGKTKPDGTVAAILTTLISDFADHDDLRTYGPVASGYAIYRLLKQQLDRDGQK